MKEHQNIESEKFLLDLDAQDIVLHNIQLAIQGCIDISNHIIADRGWGVPSVQSEAFNIMASQKVTSPGTADIMRKMTGFRNLIIHEYQQTDFLKVHEILNTRLNDIQEYLRQTIKFCDL